LHHQGLARTGARLTPFWNHVLGRPECIDALRLALAARISKDHFRNLLILNSDKHVFVANSYPFVTARRAIQPSSFPLSDDVSRRKIFVANAISRCPVRHVSRVTVPIPAAGIIVTPVLVAIAIIIAVPIGVIITTILISTVLDLLIRKLAFGRCSWAGVSAEWYRAQQ
jgi:hypothetical protein